MLKYFVKAQTRAMEIQDRPKDEEGAALVEYGLLIALIAIIAIPGVTLIGPKLLTLYTNIANKL